MLVVPPKTTLDAVLPLCERDDARLRAGLTQSFARLSHLDLLESSSNVYVGACSIEIGSIGIGHLVSPCDMCSVSCIPAIRRAASGKGDELHEGREAGWSATWWFHRLQVWLWRSFALLL
jgi:hypothetical protein